MPASTIIVQYGDGTPVRHVRVVLGFQAGMTNEFFTDNYGQAVVEHASVGNAKVYVSGKSYGSFHAPGRMAVTIT